MSKKEYYPITGAIRNLFDNFATVVRTEDGDTYKYLPFWFKEVRGKEAEIFEIRRQEKFELYRLGELPKNLKNHLQESRNTLPPIREDSPDNPMTPAKAFKSVYMLITSTDKISPIYTNYNGILQKYNKNIRDYDPAEHRFKTINKLYKNAYLLVKGDVKLNDYFFNQTTKKLQQHTDETEQLFTQYIVMASSDDLVSNDISETYLQYFCKSNSTIVEDTIF